MVYITWPKEEIETTNIKTMKGRFHSKSIVLRLYTKRKEGGRGLVSFKVAIQDGSTKIHEDSP